MKSILSCALSFAATCYTLWYMHFDRPWTNDGALSTIGLEHRGLFAVWGIITLSALGFALFIAYRSVKKTKLLIPLFLLSSLGMALTLIFRFQNGLKPDFYLHCAGSLTFSAVTGVAVFLIFIMKKRKSFAVITAAILIIDLIFLIICKETGLIETVPIFAGYILLGIENVRSERLEASRKAEIA